MVERDLYYVLRSLQQPVAHTVEARDVASPDQRPNVGALSRVVVCNRSREVRRDSDSSVDLSVVVQLELKSARYDAQVPGPGVPCAAPEGGEIPLTLDHRLSGSRNPRKPRRLGAATLPHLLTAAGFTRMLARLTCPR